MSWTLLVGLAIVLGLSLLVTISRRAELARMQRAVGAREQTARQGGNEAQLQHPVIDLSRCLGCATCVAVCPEKGVLDIVHGQAMLVNPARCVGVAACERECPVGAVTITLANLAERRDIPVVDHSLEAVGSPGLFLAGEVTAHALIKTAIEHGTAVADEVARRDRAHEDGVLDLCIVGAGPAGLACSLQATRHGLSFLTLDHEEQIGGTVAKYPRRKLVLTQPVDLPLHGRLKKTTYTKEELIELWERIAAEHALPIRHGEALQDIERSERGHYVVRTSRGTHIARHVCLALGRRGIPRKLDVPGEELPKVAYSLLDAQSYRGRRILVVGGGDAAVETALALAQQEGNEVTLSYRKESFFRIRSETERRLEAQDRIQVMFRSEVREIADGAVEIVQQNGVGERTRSLPNDDVFVMAGGTPPFELLERAGVSFDPSQRPAPEPIAEQGTGLVKALAAGLLLTLLALGFALWHGDYYLLDTVERPTHAKHQVLRPGHGIGLWLGISASTLVLLNLLYLARRARWLRLGSLQGWMTSHIATGILALLCAALHAAMSPRDTVGGQAFWALAALLVTGAIGRYFYAFVPRAANGRELELSQIKAQLGGDMLELIERRQWRGTFFGRLFALLGFQRDLKRVLARVESQGGDVALARKAHRTALMAAHYEDLRALLGSWRYLHRWVALLMVLLVLLHIFTALFYGGSR